VSDTVRTRPKTKLYVVILCGADARYGAGPLHVQLDERDLETGLQGGYVGPVKRMRRQQTTPNLRPPRHIPIPFSERLRTCYRWD
jgi:hypothetical protein